MILSQRTRQSITGWIYPPVCAICESPLPAERQIELPFLCESCEEKFVEIGSDYCRICGQSYETEMPLGSGCSNCGDRELATDFAVGAYRNSGPARELMHALKYGRQLPLARLMGTLMQRVWHDDRLCEAAGWWVVPVPLHRRRLRERGFNQAAEIAREFVRGSVESSESLPPMTILPILRRTRHSGHQARLDRRDRLQNIVGAFSLRHFRPRRLNQEGRDGWGYLLVDDVITTGSTVSECAAVLRSELGEIKVAAVSPMRG